MKKTIKKSLPLLSLCLMVSCGEAIDSKSSPSAQTPGNETTQNEIIVSDGSNINGFYAADLAPVNYNLHFLKVGAAGVERDNDRFSAYVRLKYGPKDIEHTQAIYTGRRCPNINDDLNKDAYIDIKEALIAIGKITIPLDDNIESQEEGQYQYPRGDVNTGKYYYERTASFERMFADLKSEDTDAEDNIIKIPEDDGLTFPGRVVLIQGASEKKELPETVASFEGVSPYKTIPVACGILWKVKERPAELMPDGQ